MAADAVDFDVIVIGSGQAGVPLATRLAAAGRRVLVAERGPPGGTCINYGCTPTKTMVASARAAHVARTCGRLGVRAGAVEVDLPAIVARKDRIVGEWREGIRKQLVETEGVTLVAGHARFVGAREIEVAGARYRAATVIVNTGGRPVVPPLAGLDGVPWVDNDGIMQLRAVPRHLVVLGGGYIGCEFAQMFRRFGAAVTMVDRGEHLLGREDREVSEEVEKAFRGEGIALELGARVEKVARAGDGIALTLGGGRAPVSGSHLLVATGRRPNSDDLGCAAAGVELDERGYLRIDDQFRTTAPGVYAVGDVAGEPQFTHVSWDDHRILYDLLLGRSQRGRGGRAFPYTVFTDPQVAGVGLTEREARERGVDVEVASQPFGSIARAVELDETAGLLKVLMDRRSERLVGAVIVGAEAGELIHVFVTLIQAQASPRAIVDAQFVHPTFAEGVQSVVMALERFRLR